MLQSEEASTKYCQAKLDLLSKALMKSISEGSFCSWREQTLQESNGKVTMGLFPCAQERSEGEEQGEHGSHRIESRGSPENLRAKHHVWVMREHGDIMKGLVFKAHYMVFISENTIPTPLKWISKITRQNRNYSFLHTTK